MAEYIGYRNSIGGGLYDMGLTDEEIIRCRNCRHSYGNGEHCEEWANEWGDAEVDPNGFCAWAERGA